MTLLSPVISDDPRALDTVLAQAFFQPWLVGGLYSAKGSDFLQNGQKQGRRCCDYAILFADTLILIDVHQTILDGKMNIQEEWEKYHNVALWKSRRYFNKLESSLNQEVLYTDSACTQPMVLQPAKVLKICVTAAYERIRNKQFSAILHSHGTIYYGEDFVLGEDENPLLVYSVGDFATLIGQLNAFPDLLDFLDYHRQAILAHHEHSYGSELELLEQYISLGKPFDIAQHLEDEWLINGLKQQQSPFLRQALRAPAKAFVQLHNKAELWQKLIAHYARFAQDSSREANAERLALCDLLANESLASQAHLAAAMVSQAGLAAARANDGYLVHIRSYHHPKRHYVLFFYAEESSSRYARDTMLHNLSTLAEQVNAREQYVVLDDIVVMGIRSLEGKFVSADIAHLTGYTIANSQNNQPRPKIPTHGDVRAGGIRRNDPCVCGSGKRYKHCCGV